MHRLLTVPLVVAFLLTPAAPLLAQSTPAPKPQESLPQFTILIFERPADLALRNDRARADAYWTAYDQFAASLAAAGALRGGSALSEQTTAVVRGTGGANNAVAGAHLGGYFVIAARDLTAAKTLAAKAPAFAVAVEVRPHRDNPHMATMPPRAP